MIDQSKVRSVSGSSSPAREAELNQALELFHFAFRAFTAKPDQLLESRGLQRVHLGFCILSGAIPAFG
jgi:hypothetical protein